jgi:hypothetical protein
MRMSDGGYPMWLIKVMLNRICGFRHPMLVYGSRRGRVDVGLSEYSNLPIRHNGLNDDGYKR